jgi:diaminohydroxyphosphoribosylaminopyrimidine deaminase/5-amino-6-(5-phosphoribosylamino)uracil reductase
MRDRSDAIMVGIDTVLADDPQLNTRLPKGGHDPIRVVVDSNLRLPLSARVLTVDSESGIIVVTTGNADDGRIAELEKAGADVVVVPAVGGQVNLQEMVAELGRIGLQSILLEGGASLAAAALRQCIVDRVAIFIAPKLLGGNDGKMLFNGPGLTVMNEAINLKNIRVSRFGDDILVEGEVA